MSLDKAISNMTIEEINHAVNERSAWIEQYIETSLENSDPVNIETVRQWSNEMYALNSLRVHRFLEIQKESA